MATEGDFGSAVFKIKGDNRDLRKALSNSQKDVTKASAKISDGLNKVKVSSQGVSQSFQSMGLVASLTGNRFVTMAKDAGELLRVLAGASLGPFIAALVVVAALVTAIFARQHIADWIEGVGEAREATAKLEKKLSEQLAAREKRLTSIRRQTEILRGQQREFEFEGPTVEAALVGLKAAREAKTRKDRLAAEAVQREKAAAQLFKQQKERNQALRDEVDILRGRKTIYDLILNAEERELTLGRDRLKEEQRITEEKKKQAEQNRIAARDAAKARRERLGLLTPHEIVRGLKEDVTTALGNQLKDFQRKRLIEALPSDLRDPARRLLGVGTERRFDFNRFSARSISEFGGAAGLKVLAGTATPESKRTPEMTLQEMKQIKKILEKIERQESGLGATV